MSDVTTFAGKTQAWTMRPSALALGLALAVAALAPMSEARAEVEGEAQAAHPYADEDSYQRSQRLFSALRDILDEAARRRLAQQTNPDGALEEFVYRQFGMDERGRVRELLSSAFEMMTDAPVVDMQKEIQRRRQEIAKLREQIGEIREQRISAPEDGGMSSWLGLSDDQDSLDSAIEALEGRIEAQENAITATKMRFANAMEAAGAPLPQEQADLLLESVTGEDIVELAAAYEAVRGVSGHLKKLMDESGEDLTYAKRYYGMHAALVALLVESQTNILNQIDGVYLPRLAAIERDITSAAQETDRLLKDDPTEAQKSILEANRNSQKVARDALILYRDYLNQQRQVIEAARTTTVKELRVADNTLRTVDASFHLRALMENANSSFEALRSMRSPELSHAFQNEQLRRQFQELTDKLAPGS